MLNNDPTLIYATQRIGQFQIFWRFDTKNDTREILSIANVYYSKAEKEKNLKLLDLDFEKKIEKRISDYIQNNLSFCVFQVDTKEQRLFWESKIVSTLAKSNELKPSKNWLGNSSTKDKIKASGLWQVNELYNEDTLL